MAFTPFSTFAPILFCFAVGAAGVGSGSFSPRDVVQDHEPWPPVMKGQQAPSWPEYPEELPLVMLMMQRLRGRRQGEKAMCQVIILMITYTDA